MRILSPFLLVSCFACSASVSLQPDGGAAPDAAGAAGAGPAQPMPDAAAPADDPSCRINSAEERAPGWPYDLPRFRTAVLPMVVATCASCHAPPSGPSGFTVWPDAAPGNCSYAKTFNSLKAKLDIDNPRNSAAIVAITASPSHPLKLNAGDDKVRLLIDWATDAKTRSGTGAGIPTPPTPPAPPPPPASPFDLSTFERTIQPILDGAEGRGCTTSSCHGAPAGTGGVTFKRQPAPASAEMLANFNAATGLCNLQQPEQSLLLLRASARHASGGSAIVTPAEALQIRTWIQQAAMNGPGPTGPGAPPPPPSNCPPPDRFNLPVFRDEIQPILFGRLDLNARNSGRTSTGCASSACHGADRTGGALVLKQTADAAANLQSFACFVSLQNPTQSELLLCPLNQPGCRRFPHPGQEVFGGPDDLNYQRVLSFLYAAKTVATPIDFAFYVRRIDTIFNDVNAVQGGAQNRTCANTTSCHGVTQAGQPAPNGSNLALIVNATGRDRLAFNFSSASSFINFISPEGSSLFLYPTDQVANLANPFATGLHHPGGLDFAPDSAQAQAILAWSHGLRPDGQGLLSNWLVAGDYPAAAITDPTAIDELNVTPAIFDPDGASQFNGGQWDGFFPGQARVDLNQPFPRAQTSGRVVYAVAYLINASSADVQAQLTIVSPNAVRLYVDKTPVLQANDARQGATGLALLPAFQTQRKATRVLLKLFQRPTDTELSFVMRAEDQFGNPLTDATGELLVKLSPDGGI